MWQLVEIIDGRYVVFSVHLFNNKDAAIKEAEKICKMNKYQRQIVAIELIPEYC